MTNIFNKIGAGPEALANDFINNNVSPISPGDPQPIDQWPDENSVRIFDPN